MVATMAIPLAVGKEVLSGGASDSGLASLSVLWKGMRSGFQLGAPSVLRSERRSVSTSTVMASERSKALVLAQLSVLNSAFERGAAWVRVTDSGSGTASEGGKGTGMVRLSGRQKGGNLASSMEMVSGRRSVLGSAEEPWVRGWRMAQGSVKTRAERKVRNLA